MRKNAEQYQALNKDESRYQLNPVYQQADCWCGIIYNIFIQSITEEWKGLSCTARDPEDTL